MKVVTSREAPHEDDENQDQDQAKNEDGGHDPSHITAPPVSLSHLQTLSSPRHDDSDQSGHSEPEQLQVRLERQGSGHENTSPSLPAQRVTPTESTSAPLSPFSAEVAAMMAAEEAAQIRRLEEAEAAPLPLPQSQPQRQVTRPVSDRLLAPSQKRNRDSDLTLDRTSADADPPTPKRRATDALAPSRRQRQQRVSADRDESGVRTDHELEQEQSENHVAAAAVVPPSPPLPPLPPLLPLAVDHHSGGGDGDPGEGMVQQIQRAADQVHDVTELLRRAGQSIWALRQECDRFFDERDRLRDGLQQLSGPPPAPTSPLPHGFPADDEVRDRQLPGFARRCFSRWFSA